MRTRRLLFVGGSGDPGGLHVHTADVAHAAAALGNRVKIIAVEEDYFSDILPKDIIGVEHIKRLSFQDLTLSLKKYRISRAVRWASVLWRHPGYDIVFCRGTFAETPIVELLMARAAFRRIYTIEHFPLAITWRSRFSKQQYGAVMNACVRRTITVSAQLSEVAAREFRIAPDKLRICLNWVDPMFVPPTPAARRLARERLGLPDGVFAIGYLGRYGPEKNIDILIDAFAACRRSRPAANTMLVIAGGGWFRDQVESRVRSSPAAAHIRLVGWQSDPRLIYHALDLFVLPSQVEGFPLSLIEAMATGLPCIAHPMSSTLDLIHDGRNGLVSDISTANLLCDRLTGLLDADAATRSRLGEAAAQTVATLFSREARLPAVLAALDIPLAGAGLPPPFPRALRYRQAASGSEA